MATKTPIQEQENVLLDRLVGWMPRPVRREMFGATLVLAGLFALACLVTGPDNARIVGSVGESLRGAMVMILGGIAAFLVPAAMIWMGVETFLGKARRWSLLRVFGIFFMVWAFTGLLALSGADVEEARQATLARAGILGAFLVDGQGLGLDWRFGTLGAGLILVGMVLVGLVLTTNTGLVGLWQMLMLRRSAAEAEAPASSPAPEPTAKTKTPRRKSAIAEPDPEPVVVDEAPDDDVDGALRPSLWSRLRGLVPIGSGADHEDRPRILPTSDDLGEWEDPLDEDVAAAARALEEHEWQRRLSGSVRVRHREEEFDDEDPLAEEADLEEYEDELPPDEAIGMDEADDEEFAEEEEDDEIIFRDHSAPLPVAEGNPANAKLGEGLAKLFPNRWPKEGTPVSAQKDDGLLDEDDEKEFSAHERRMLRRTDENGRLVDEHGDPLFTEEFDTRPYGPNGKPTDIELAHDEEEYHEPEIYTLPEIELLADPPKVESRMTREEVLETSATLTRTLADFGVEGKVTEVHQGPVVTRFEFRPAAGIKVSRIVGLEHDIAMGMKAISVRIMAPIPGKNAVGIEVPNKKPQGVYLKELLSCPDFWEDDGALAFALGKTIDGSPYFANLAKMPHLLIAGATGAGKSVCLNTIICSILYRRSPDEVKMIMVDPKRVELSVYADIPHLLAPVVCEPKCAAAALDWAVEQMEERYKQLVEFGVRNIEGYNRIASSPDEHPKARGRRIKPMPYMIVIVDELADLMVTAKNDVEESIQRLAQMARAVGIHLILATQRPSVNVITGIIKANFPSRIAFQVSQKVDSRTILDSNGAEALLGRGDMLFSKGGAGKPIRIQGAFLSDEEVERIAQHCRDQRPVAYEVEEFQPKLSEKEQKELAKMMGGDISNMDDLDYQDRVVRGTNKAMGKVSAGMFIPHDGGSARAGDDEIDEALVRAAARLILEARSASVSMLQRRLKVGFARAGRLMDMLHEMGIVGEFKGSKPRDIMVDPEAALIELDRLEEALSSGRSVEEIRDELDGDEDEYDDEEMEADDPDAPWPTERRA